MSVISSTIFLLLLHTLSRAPFVHGLPVPYPILSRPVKNETASGTPSDVTASTTTPPFTGHSWIVVIVILLCALLQLNVRSVWAESRMLRKLRQKLRSDGGRSFVSAVARPNDAPNDTFARLFEELSQGRHRLSGRLYPNMLPLLIWAIDLVVQWPPYPQFEMEVLSSGALTTFRFLMTTSSLIVLGARAFTIIETFVLIFLLSGYISSIVSVHYYVRISHATALAFGRLHIAVIGVAILAGVQQLYQAGRGDGCNVSDIAFKITQGTLDENRRQMRHMAAMREQVKMSNLEGEIPRGTTGGSYWKLDAWSSLTIGISAFIFAENIVYSSVIGSELLPLFAILETCELMALVLFLFNDSQVQPVLFLELLKLAQVSCTPSCGTDSPSPLYYTPSPS